MNKHITDFFTRKRLGDLVCLVLVLLPPLLRLWTVYKYGVNIPFWDEWSFLPRLDKFYSGTITLSDLWTPSNEHRAPFYFLMDFGLGWLTHYNRLGNLYLGLVFRLLALWIAWNLLNFSFGDKQPRSMYYLIVFFSLLSFTPLEFENWIFPLTALVWNFQVFCALLTVWFLARYHGHWLSFLGALGIVLISSLTNGIGLPLWLVGWVGLVSNRVTIEQKRGWHTEFLWCIAIVLFLGIYYHDFPANTQFSQRMLYVIHHGSDAVLFMLSFLSGPFLQRTTLDSAISFIGLASNAIALYIFLHRQSKRLPAALPWFLLSLYSVINAGIIMFGRVQLGIQSVGASRYLAISSLFWIGTSAVIVLACQEILSILDIQSGQRKERSYHPVIRMVAAFCSLSIIYSYGVDSYASYENNLSPWNNRLKKGYDQVLNYRHFPQMVTELIHPDPTIILQGAQILDKWDLGPFSTNSSKTISSESLPLAKPGTYDDRSQYLVYNGNWFFQTHPNMYKTTYTYSEAIGDLAEFRFEGMGVNLRYYKQTGQDYGIMDIYLNGNLVAALDMNSDRFEPKQVWKSKLLAPGEYTLTMVHRTGQFVAIDAIIVRDHE